MTDAAPSPRQATTPLIAALSLASLGWYALFLFNPAHIGHPVAYGIMAVAEIIGMIQLVGVWMTILVAPQPPEPPRVGRIREALARQHRIPLLIAAFVPVAGEPLHVIRRTVTAARDMHVPHRTFILDDAKSDEVAALAAEIGVEYIRREGNAGWKAGNLNNALKVVKPDFVAVFDSDHAPQPDFLLQIMPYLIADDHLAFVQTPQHYENTREFIAGGSAQAQDVFYRHIQPGKNAFNAAFCVGTNHVFRREALDEIGGFYAGSHSEDIWTSILLHERGWKSFFLPTVLAGGDAPDRVDSYFKQQYRWATGGFEILKYNPMRRSLTLDQKLQYMHTALFFLTGFSVAAFFLLPLLYVYLGWRPLTVPEGGFAWAARFLPYYVMLYVAATHLMGSRPRWGTFVAALTAFPAHMSAFVAVLFGIRLRWSVTGVIRRKTDYVKSVAPHMLLLLLSLGAIPLVVQQERDPWLAMLSVFWLFWNCAILFSIVVRAFPVRRAAAAEAPATSLAFAS